MRRAPTKQVTCDRCGGSAETLATNVGVWQLAHNVNAHAGVDGSFTVTAGDRELLEFFRKDADQ